MIIMTSQLFRDGVKHLLRDDMPYSVNAIKIKLVHYKTYIYNT